MQPSIRLHYSYEGADHEVQTSHFVRFGLYDNHHECPG